MRHEGCARVCAQASLYNPRLQKRPWRQGLTWLAGTLYAAASHLVFVQEDAAGILNAGHVATPVRRAASGFASCLAARQLPRFLNRTCGSRPVPGLMRSDVLSLASFLVVVRNVRCVARTGEAKRFFTVNTVMSEDFASVSLDDLMGEVAALIVEALNLDVQPQDVVPDEPLYGEGLGLDSIDMLEISLVISKRFGFQLRSDDENNQTIYSSLRALSRHIASQRTK
jgi:acyl carrier protein